MPEVSADQPKPRIPTSEMYDKAKSPAEDLLKIEKEIKEKFTPRTTKAKTPRYPLDFSRIGVAGLNFEPKENPSDLDIRSTTKTSIILTVNAASQLEDPFSRKDIAKDQELLVLLIKALENGNNLIRSERIENQEVVDKIIQDNVHEDNISNRLRTVRWVIERLRESQNAAEQAEQVAAIASQQLDSGEEAAAI